MNRNILSLSNLFFKKKDRNSLYIYGKPGGGKTFIVNNFYSFLKLDNNKQKVLRVHFQEFMFMVHENINKKRKNKKSKPLDEVALGIANKYRLIIFDELEILDIADAMIVSKLFNVLLSKGILFIITSNYRPNELYKNGLQRSQFEPFIDLVNKRMRVLKVSNDRDLRLSKNVKSSKNFIYPLNKNTKDKFEILFSNIGKRSLYKEKKIISLGREIFFKKTISEIVFLDFEFICSYKFSPNDYIKISEYFKIIFIDNIPVLGRNKLNEIRRFIILIDILYEKKSKVFIRAEKNFLEIFDIKNLTVPFQRTVSRISEMTSKEWRK